MYHNKQKDKLKPTIHPTRSVGQSKQSNTAAWPHFTRQGRLQGPPAYNHRFSQLDGHTHTHTHTLTQKAVIAVLRYWNRRHFFLDAVLESMITHITCHTDVLFPRRGC